MRGVSGSVSIDGQRLSLSDAREGVRQQSTSPDGRSVTEIQFAWSEPDLRWTWRIEETDHALRITATLLSAGRSSVAVSDWHVLHLEQDRGGGMALGRDPENVRFFGWRPWDTRVERLAEENAGHGSNNLCHLYDPDSGTTLLSGFVTLDRMLVRHELDYSPATGVREYRATCHFGSYTLPAGEELASETLHVAYYDDPYAALDSWADEVKGIYDPSFEPAALVTYSGGTWMHVWSGQEGVWEEIILEGARAVREKLAGFGINCVSGTTHKMYKEGIPGNWYEVNEQQFPNGLPAVMDKLRAMGFKHKFWFSPFWFFAETEGVLEANRENLLRDRSGEPISEPANWEWDMRCDADDSLRLTKYYLDGTHPKTQDYVRRIFEHNRKLGVRAYMLDFLSIKENACLHDSRLLPVEAARQIIKVLREAGGEDTHLQTAVASTPGFIGLIDAARVVRDFGEGRPMAPYHAWHNATYCLHDEHFANTHSFIQNAAASYFTHRKVYINDLNCLTIDKPVPLEHARIAVTLFGLGGGSPLNLGDDIRRIDPERLRMIKLCLPRTRDMPTPVDLFDRVWPDDYCRTLMLPVETPWDSYVIVAVYNGDDEAYSTDLDFVRLGLDGDVAYRVFNFWNEEYLGTFKGSVACTVPPAAIRVYRISQVRNHPWLLSTDMHMQQGAVEVASLNWNEKTMTLSGTVTRPVGECGNVFIHIPRQLRLINHKGVGLMKDVRDMTVVARLPIHFEQEREDFELRFAELETRFVARRGWLPYASVDEWLEYVRKHRNPNDTRVVE
jgi:alpha galactosidase C-like protein